jgi:hypothetical protein
MKRSTVDNVCVSYADKGAKIAVIPLQGTRDLILIEGDRLAFEFLGRLFLAHAKGTNGCGLQIGPKYAGSALSSKKAKLGLYLHCLPCDNDILKAHEEARAKKKQKHK